MRGTNESLLDKATKAHLQRLTDLLKENELIQDYQMIEEKAQNHAHLNQLIADIKIKQKEAVAFNHYGKPEAEKIAIKEAEAFTKEFNEHMVVTSYQDALVEANDILQHLVATVQDELKEQINQTLEDNR
ncbi:RicAFT regulatory complex protein RicA family protein [Carnobacterium maltaromaticum]|uniref:RicAFT regulatory complex protein RicA family protein n=1 Tax=Carnobacterium maltaromaticum TaxID=2751 RepID=UPI0039BDDEAD